METTSTHPCGHPVRSNSGLPLTGAAALARLDSGCQVCRRKAATAARDAYEASGQAEADRRSWAAAEAAEAARVANWVPKARATAQAALRRAGCVRELTSASGSSYYRHPASGLRVRISDHEVPMTAERRDARRHGARACAEVEIVLCGTTLTGRRVAITDEQFARQMAQALEILADG